MLKIAYIATNSPAKQKRPRKQTEKELIHELAMATLAERRIHDKQKARQLFAPELDALRQLRLKADINLKP